MRGATDGRFPDTRRTLRTHVSHPRKGHGAGACVTKGPSWVGAPVQASRRVVAGKTGPCLAKVRGGSVRARLFLASAFRVQGRQHAEEQHRVLEGEIREERPAGCRGATSTQTSRLASVRCLGVRTELNGEVGEGRPAPRGTNTTMTMGDVVGPVASSHDVQRLCAVQERGPLNHRMAAHEAAGMQAPVIGEHGSQYEDWAASISSLSGSLPENISETMRWILPSRYRLVRIQHAPRCESGIAPLLHAVRGELPHWSGLAFL